jgi:hypothetical protein
MLHSSTLLDAAHEGLIMPSTRTSDSARPAFARVRNVRGLPALRSGLIAVLFALSSISAFAEPTLDHSQEGIPMKSISGSFEVRMSPQPGELEAEGIGQFRLDKSYSGPLEASAVGLMTAHRTAVEGSAGYVAIERVRGTLEGRRGSFVLQHSGLMWDHTRQLVIEVIPDSADDELTGLRGRMGIRIEDGAHFYDFEYSLPGAR